MAWWTKGGMVKSNFTPSHTLHDLLKLHLQGLDCTTRVITSGALDSVYGETAVHNSSHVIVFEKDHSVGVFDNCAVRVENETKFGEGTQPLASSPKN